MAPQHPVARVRGATLKDLDAVLALSAEMHAESRYAVYPFDSEVARELAVTYLRDGEKRCCIIAEAGGSPTGLIAGEVAPLVFSRIEVAYDTLFYVKPSRRGRWDSLRLLRAFDGWARSRGAMELTLSTSSAVSADRTDALLSRLGYAHVGSVCTKSFKL
ncbi:MAG: hypothetical protein DM484_12815 [Candidatus Methylumidiphilus alinenensis]|uniref:N-acetyltransferase domain-containing protein n=1 Tax=Candidatus Methylumidiphilus alinenensis TaxID=2202197 RepID=A0A2W4R6E9_9GAMM|nr:MAG: hypothetical protein DM484_12815 [Candidatus Methylumidiphilus alinenensis]